MSDQGSATPSLKEKVTEWLETQGYPLEFRVARAFERSGFFETYQGQYIQDDKGGDPREIDVLANITTSYEEKCFFRISQVVECKWSKDKPWLVFTSSRSIMGEGACIAQTIASALGEAAMFCIAGDNALGDLELFKRPGRGGFAGRRAFEKNKEQQDIFYATIQGLITKSVNYAKSYGLPNPSAGQVPSSGCLAFPIIVIDGDLFEAYYDKEKDNVALREAHHIRIFWRGAPGHKRFITPVDIVTAGAVEEFAKKRLLETKALLTAVSISIANIREAFREQAFNKLEITEASRGFTSFPPLLAELYVLDKAKQTTNKLGQ